MTDIFTKDNKMLNEKYFFFKHKSGLDVYVIPKKMTTSYAIFATRYGAVDNKFKTNKDNDFTVVHQGKHSFKLRNCNTYKISSFVHGHGGFLF